MKLKKHNYAGLLIVFEGTDGAGKSTLIDLTEKYLKENYEAIKVLTTKQPSDEMRKFRAFRELQHKKDANVDFRAVQMLAVGDRIEHLYEIIIPELEAGHIVLCDRYIYTALANMLAMGYEEEKWFYEAVEYIIEPDCTFLASVPPARAIERILSRPWEKDRYFDRDLLVRVSKEFEKMSDAEDFVTIDTLKSPEEAFRCVKPIMKILIKNKENK